MQAADVIAEADRLLDLLYHIGILAIEDHELTLRRLKRRATWGSVTPDDLEDLAKRKAEIEEASGALTWRR